MDKIPLRAEENRQLSSRKVKQSTLFKFRKKSTFELHKLNIIYYYNYIYASRVCNLQMLVIDYKTKDLKKPCDSKKIKAKLFI